MNKYIFLIATIFLISPLIIHAQPAVIKYVSLDWPPMSYMDNGKAKGLYLDILSEVFEKNMNFKLKTAILPWKRAQQQVKAGNSDFMLTVPTQSRNEYSVPSKSTFFQLYLYLYTYKGHPRLNEISKIKSALDIKRLGFIPATNLGNDWHAQNIDKLGIKTRYVKKDQILPQFIAKKRADFMIEFVVAMNHQIKKLGLSNQLVLTDSRFGPINMHLLISKKSKYLKLLPKIDATFQKLKKEGKIEQIISKYMKL